MREEEIKGQFLIFKYEKLPTLTKIVFAGSDNLYNLRRLDFEKTEIVCRKCGLRISPFGIRSKEYGKIRKYKRRTNFNRILLIKQNLVYDRKKLFMSRGKYKSCDFQIELNNYFKPRINPK